MALPEACSTGPGGDREGPGRGHRVTFLAVPVHPKLQACSRAISPTPPAIAPSSPGTAPRPHPGSAERWPAQLFRDDIHFKPEHIPALTEAVLERLREGCSELGRMWGK
jgi:hypothetical protein